MKSLRNSALGLSLGIASATFALADGHAKELTIAIVNNGHMINMQKVAEAYTAETGVKLNWVSLEEGVLREQVTSDTATGGGQYDIINIGMQEAPIWGAAGWIEPLDFGADYDVDDICQQCAQVCPTKAHCTLHHSTVNLHGHVPQGPDRRCWRYNR